MLPRVLFFVFTATILMNLQPFQCLNTSNTSQHAESLFKNHKNNSFNFFNNLNLRRQRNEYFAPNTIKYADKNVASFDEVDNVQRLKRATGVSNKSKKRKKTNKVSKLKKRSTTWKLNRSSSLSRSLTNTTSFNNSELEAISKPNNVINIDEQTCCYFKEVNNDTECTISPTDIYMHSRVNYMVYKEKLNLIEYTLNFSNYSINPLFINSSIHHRPNVWSRASTNYGQVLLSLAFNYGILSLMTLTFGTNRIPVELSDKPQGCFGKLDFDEKLALVRGLLLRDFGSIEEEMEAEEDEEDIEKKYYYEGARICHEVVENVDGYAQFTDCCCYRHRFTNEKKCENGLNNFWLNFLYSLLNFIRYIIFFFGPLLFLSTLVGLTRDQFPYTVKLRDPLLKTVYLGKSDTEIPDNIRYKHLLDFSQKSTFPKMKESLSLAMRELEELRKEENDKKIEKQLNENVDSASNKTFNSDDNQIELPKSIFGTPMKVAIKDYELFVNYKRLVTENDISIGFWKTITHTIFFCKLKNVGPFLSCCRQDMFRTLPSCLRFSSNPFPWFNFWRIIGLILFAIVLPFPFYLRLLIFYYFEIDEIISRKTLIYNNGLKESFENSLLHYLLPSHPLYIFIGILYVILAVFCIIFSKQSEDGKLKKIVIASFNDLKYLSWIEVLNLLVSNIIWPFKRFGVIGCFVVFIYWPIVIPLTLIVFIIYCLPTMFLTVRILFYSYKAFHERRIKRSKKSYRIKKKPESNLHFFKIESLIKSFCGGNSFIFSSVDLDDSDSYDFDSEKFKDKDTYSKIKLMKQTSRISDNLDLDELDSMHQSQINKLHSRSLSSTVIKFEEMNKPFQYLAQFFASVICILILYSFLIIVTECLGSLVDILVFTLMGIIVNAGKLLKYIALTIMLVVYSYDSFNNVEKKYLKLNKALFTEVKCRIKDLDKVTSLPSYLQENRAFKSQELNEQAEYELCDDVSVKPPRHWFVNDLVLFVDNEDMPRIPKKLFKNVCGIKVAGVPGPVYRGLMLGMKQFLKIVVFIVFVFMVVLTFGSVYEMSNTNQMLAALAGGSLPFILRTFMEPDKPDIEMGTVSFKSKLDEVIKNFAQIWPMFDFSFELYKEEEEEMESGDEKEDESLKRRGSIKPAILPSNKNFDDENNSKKEQNEKILPIVVMNDNKKPIDFKENDENITGGIKFSNLKDIDKKVNESLPQTRKKSCLKDTAKIIMKDKKRLSALKMPTSPPPRITQCQTTIDQPRSFPIFYSNENIFSEYVSEVAPTQERHEEETVTRGHSQVGPTKSNMSVRVCFSESSKSVYEEVDLLIIIPENFEETIKLNSEPTFTNAV